MVTVSRWAKWAIRVPLVSIFLVATGLFAATVNLIIWASEDGMSYEPILDPGAVELLRPPR